MSMKRWGLGVVVLAAAAGAGIWYKKNAESAAAVATAGGPAPAAAGSAPRGASGPGGGGPGGPGGAGGPPVSVSTVKAVQRDQPVLLEATGTVTSLNTVEVRPQVNSVITQVHVREGQFVKRGELLFTLDARNDEVNLTKARAQLARDQAALGDAQRQFERSRDLVRQNFISQSAVDTAQTQVESQRAAVAASKAAIEAAQVGLGYNRITARSPGRVGAINVFAGSYVTPATAMLTITQLDPIAVSFSLPQRNLADALQALRGDKLPVYAQLPDAATARGARLDGRLQFVDSAVDVTSGTVKVKAVFDNAKQQLWPGAYVNVQMTVQTIKGAIVVPQAAIITGQRGRTVYVVEPGNKAAVRRVDVVHAAGDEAVVTGLQVGDRVVVDGRQNVRPGSTVVERAPDAPRGAGKPGKGASGADAAPGGASAAGGPGAGGSGAAGNGAGGSAAALGGGGPAVAGSPNMAPALAPGSRP